MISMNDIIKQLDEPHREALRNTYEAYKDRYKTKEEFLVALLKNLLDPALPGYKRKTTKKNKIKLQPVDDELDFIFQSDKENLQ